VFGTTATPRRLDGKPLDDIFDGLVIGPSIAHLIDDEWLAPCTVFVPARAPDLSKVEIRAGDYAIDQLSTAMSNSIIVGSAVEEYERIAPAGHRSRFVSILLIPSSLPKPIGVMVIVPNTSMAKRRVVSDAT
jgi:superfamily II DNA or RNA helicase